MKTSTLPPLRVEPALRTQVEQVLRAGESLSAFVEAAVRQGLHARLAQQEFVARGLASLESARDSGDYVTAQQSMERLERKLKQARAIRGRSSPAGRA